MVSVQINNSSTLTAIDVSNCLTLVGLECSSDHLTSLDVSKNKALAFLYCPDNDLASLDVSNNTALKSLSCQSNDLVSLKASNDTVLTWLDCSGNKLISLDVSNDTALESLNCRSNQLTLLDVSDSTVLTNLDCTSNQLISLDVNNNKALVMLQCGSNKLVSLRASNIETLTNLTCTSNLLTSLDASNNTAMTYLQCDSNRLASLDVSGDTALSYMTCTLNLLTSLDLSGCSGLGYLDCRKNLLTNLDIAQNKKLIYLKCSYNYISYTQDLERCVSSHFGEAVPQYVSMYHDIDSTSWYVTGGWLSYVLTNGLMSGYSGTDSFGPYNDITRAQAATVMYRYACGQDSTISKTYGSTTDPAKFALTSNHFSDDPGNQYYTAALNWAYDTGILTGNADSDGRYAFPDNSVTREQLCKMFQCFANVFDSSLANSFETVDYSNTEGMNTVSDWVTDASHINYVKWCASRGIVGGVSQGDGTYQMNPQDTAWRASMAKMITVTLRDILG